MADTYKIIHPIAVGDAGATVTEDALLEAGVNIAALIASGHIESSGKTAKKNPEE